MLKLKSRPYPPSCRLFIDYAFVFRYDPHATQFINFAQLSDFIASLDSPLGIPKPNILALVSFDLPIAKGDKIHCLDVLHSLTKYTLGFVDDGDEDFGKVSVFSLFFYFFPLYFMAKTQWGLPLLNSHINNYEVYDLKFRYSEKTTKM